MSTFTRRSEKALCFRPLNCDAVLQLKEMWNGSYDLEIGRNVIDERALYNGSELVAYGVLKNMAEAVIVLDPNSSKRTQIESLRLLYHQAIKACKELKIADLHAFTTDEKCAQILIEKFGFNRVKGIPLILDLR